MSGVTSGRPLDDQGRDRMASLRTWNGIGTARTAEALVNASDPPPLGEDFAMTRMTRTSPARPRDPHQNAAGRATGQALGAVRPVESAPARP